MIVTPADCYTVKFCIFYTLMSQFPALHASATEADPQPRSRQTGLATWGCGHQFRSTTCITPNKWTGLMGVSTIEPPFPGLGGTILSLARVVPSLLGGRTV
jgi:hypothetical protein